LKKLGEVAGRYILSALGDAAKTIGAEVPVPNADRIESIGEKWEKANLAEKLSTDSIRGFLNETIKSLLPDGDGARLVVFIDDLDRCNSTAAFRLLEGLKIYLNVPRCVFVIGMNEQALVDAISKRFEGRKLTVSLPSLRVDAFTGVTTTGHEWDGLTELNHPLPKWWLYVWYACIAWSLVYYVLYPSWPLGRTYLGGLLNYNERIDLDPRQHRKDR